MSMQSQEPRGYGRIVPFRRERLQVRVSEDEHARLAERARCAGFESISAYVRAAALGRPLPPTA